VRYGRHLLKWDHTIKTLHDYKAEIGGAGLPSCFAEDASGNVWIGFEYGEPKLVRISNERVDVFSNDQIGATEGITALWFDQSGALWFASRAHGVGRIERPTSQPLQIFWYDRKNGLSTNGTLCVVGDNFGHMYVCHGRGVDVIHPDTGQTKHYTTADGLPQGSIHFGARDVAGSLWFGNYGGGVARLIPTPDKPQQPPNILLTGLRVRGEKQPVSELGQTQFPEQTLDSSQTHVSIDFLGLGASLGEELKYRYHLEGSGSSWSEPTSQRTIDFANLAPGSYRLLVKAVTAQGVESTQPATFPFMILRPIWQRWWFLLTAATAIALTVFSVYRYRVARLLELERVRTRIASDLHDDIGASLSRIAIMSEVVKQKASGQDKESLPLLSDIADSARELTGSMRDIVWAIDPRRDDLQSAVARIRQFAFDVFEAKSIEWDFETPTSLEMVQLGPDQRRHILLFFKEAINNIVRHSNCTAASLKIGIENQHLVGEVHDNGVGIQPNNENSSKGHHGHGILNMERRVKQLGGRLEVQSSLSEGTHLRLTIPLKR
jgi:signal transduction histidine kinase